MRNSLRNCVFRPLLVMWVIGIFYVSLSPNPVGDFVLYAVLGAMALHIVAFSVLVILLYLSLGMKEIKGGLLALLLVAMAISFIKEIGQLGVIGREFSLLDIALDFLAAFTSVALIFNFELWHDKSGRKLIQNNDPGEAY